MGAGKEDSLKTTRERATRVASFLGSWEVGRQCSAKLSGTLPASLSLPAANSTAIAARLLVGAIFWTAAWGNQPGLARYQAEGNRLFAVRRGRRVRSPWDKLAVTAGRRESGRSERREGSTPSSFWHGACDTCLATAPGTGSGLDLRLFKMNQMTVSGSGHCNKYIM